MQTDELFLDPVESGDETATTGSSSEGAEIIYKDSMKVVNLPDCQHEYVLDPSDETDQYFAIKCRKPGCIHGRLLNKSVHQKATYI